MKIYLETVKAHLNKTYVNSKARLKMSQNSHEAAVFMKLITGLIIVCVDSTTTVNCYSKTEFLGILTKVCRIFLF